MFATYPKSFFSKYTAFAANSGVHTTNGVYCVTGYNFDPSTVACVSPVNMARAGYVAFNWLIFDFFGSTITVGSGILPAGPKAHDIRKDVFPLPCGASNKYKPFLWVEFIVL